MEDEHGVETERSRQLHRILGLLDFGPFSGAQRRPSTAPDRRGGAVLGISHVYHNNRDDRRRRDARLATTNGSCLSATKAVLTQSRTAMKVQVASQNQVRHRQLQQARQLEKELGRLQVAVGVALHKGRTARLVPGYFGGNQRAALRYAGEMLVHSSRPKVCAMTLGGPPFRTLDDQLTVRGRPNKV